MVPAVRLGLVQRLVGGGDERVGRVQPRIVHGDPRADRDRLRPRLRRPELFRHAAGEGECARGIARGEDRDELVAAEARREARAPRGLVEDPREAAQDLVALGVAPAVVVRLEPVEVEEHDGDRPPALRRGELRLEEDARVAAVRDSGQLVEQREPLGSHAFPEQQLRHDADAERDRDVRAHHAEQE